MTLLELVEDVRGLAGLKGSRADSAVEIAGLLDRAQRDLVSRTWCLQGGEYLTLVKTGVTGTQVELNTAKYLLKGHRVDFIQAAGTREASNCRITAVDHATEKITLAGTVTVTTDTRVWWRNDYGFDDTVAGQAEYDLPRSCLDLIQVAVLDSSDADYRPVNRGDPNSVSNVEARLYGSGAGTPRVVWLRGAQQIVLCPAPATGVAAGLRFRFARQPRRLLDATDTPDIEETWQPLLAYYAAAHLLGMHNNIEGMTAQMALYQRGLDDLAGMVGPKTPLPQKQTED